MWNSMTNTTFHKYQHGANIKETWRFYYCDCPICRTISILEAFDARHLMVATAAISYEKMIWVSNNLELVVAVVKKRHWNVSIKPKHHGACTLVLKIHTLINGSRIIRREPGISNYSCRPTLSCRDGRFRFG